MQETEEKPKLSPEDKRIRKAAKEFIDAIAEEKIKREGIVDEDEKQEAYKDTQREIFDCNMRIQNLPYSNLEEQAAVVSMLSEHCYMQIRKFRDDRMSIEEINWLVDEMQDGLKKLMETVDRIIKHEGKDKA